MASLNHCTFIGNLGADPEIRQMPSGNPVANFRIACSESWKDKETGEKKESTEWISVVCFNENLIRVIEQYMHKGSKVYVAGKFKTRKWQDKDGQDRYTTEIEAEEMKMLGGRGQGGGEGSSAPAPQRGQQGNGGGQPRRQAPSGGGMDDFEDDIPF